MYGWHAALELGLVKLGIAAVFGLVIGFLEEAARYGGGKRWTTVLKQPPHKRLLNWLRGRGQTTVEVRKTRR